jgi:DNA-binding transcriptional ArsR family regulator
MLDALADPMRRELVKRLVDGPRSVTDLAEGLPVTRPAVSQHLRVLREARLVTTRPEGTRRIYAVDPDALAILRGYFESFWSRSLEAFRQTAARDHEQEEMT